MNVTDDRQTDRTTTFKMAKTGSCNVIFTSQSLWCGSRRNTTTAKWGIQNGDKM